MLDNLSSNQRKILIIVGIIVILGLVYFIYNKMDSQNNIEVDDEILVLNTQENTEEISSNTEEDIIVVHVTGAVNSPGVVRLVEGSRIEDAIEAAGGLQDTADISDVNLAYVLDDGIKLRIPYLNEENTDENSEEEEILIEDSGDVIEDETESSYEKKININKATVAELETLPGIGEAIAGKIITYREENGDFSTIEEIKNVNGIGDSKYENIKDLISVK